MGLDRTVSDRNPAIVYPVSRTDTLIAVTFDPRGDRIFALSVPRDTRAEIPGHGVQKINAAHAYGGVPLTLRTVENFLGVPFPYYMEITERGLVHLIDAVGGVTFRNDALGDIGRIARQQQLVNALLAELRRPRVILRAGRILRVFREDIHTNLTPEQLIALAWFGARLPRSHLVTMTLPGRFGASDWIADRDKAREVVARAFYGVDPSLLARETVDVVASPEGGADVRADALARLTALGVRVLHLTSGPLPVDVGEPTVVVHRGDPGAARAVAASLGARLLAREDAAAAADLTVVLPPRSPDPR